MFAIFYKTRRVLEIRAYKTEQTMLRRQVLAIMRHANVTDATNIGELHDCMRRYFSLYCAYINPNPNRHIISPTENNPDDAWSYCRIKLSSRSFSKIMFGQQRTSEPLLRAIESFSYEPPWCNVKVRIEDNGERTIVVQSNVECAPAQLARVIRCGETFYDMSSSKKIECVLEMYFVVALVGSTGPKPFFISEIKHAN